MQYPFLIFISLLVGGRMKSLSVASYAHLPFTTSHGQNENRQ